MPPQVDMLSRLMQRGDSDNDDNSNVNDNGDNDESLTTRKGTISSASFNILSTMVGGGSLSLPLAFHQAGNGFMAPLLLIISSFLAQYSIHFLVQASQLSIQMWSSSSSSSSSSLSNNNKKGNASYESVASSAFGPCAKYFSMGLVSTICFFSIIGYAVLLRDMLLPLSDAIFPTGIGTVNSDDNINSSNNNDGPTMAHNITLLFFMLLVTPLCTLRNLTALESVGAASMIAVFVLACCISYRSMECNLSSKYDDVRKMPWKEYIHFFPSTEKSSSTTTETTAWDDVLNALPILISVFMCHFNVLPVHNELSNPTPKRVNSLFRTTIWGACVFYLFFGFIGSMYGNCTPSGAVQGNVLLSFDEDDVLLMIGRVCLSLTITFAFPVFVVPARDTLLRGLDDFLAWRERENTIADSDGDSSGNGEYRLDDNDLSKPLLLGDTKHEEENDDGNNFDIEENDDAFEDNILMEELEEGNENQLIKEKRDNFWRIVSSICIFWTGAAISCCVKDIDVVWDVLGGSLSLIMAFMIPSGSFLVLSTFVAKRWSHENGLESKFDKVMAWTLLILFIPVMFILTGNTVYNLGI